MKLRKLSLYSFGRFRGEELELRDGINVIYGENESGKSTVHTFIRSMLFGMKRGRGRAAGSDVYSRYEPWENASWYQGRLEFESGQKLFWLTRNFGQNDRKAELICRTDGEVLSVEEGDLSMLLGGISETVYDNTVSVGQLQARTGDALAAELRNYMVNYQGSSDGSLHVEEALLSLKKKRKKLEEALQEQKKEQEYKKDEMYRRILYQQKDLEEMKQKLAQSAAERKREMFDTEVSPREVRKEQRRFLKRHRWGIACAAVAVFLTVLCVLQFFRIARLFTRLGLGLSVLALVYIIYRMVCFRREEDLVTEDPKQQKIRKLNWNVEYLEREIRQKEILCGNLLEEYEDYCEKLTEKSGYEEEISAVTLAMETIEALARRQQGETGARLRERIAEILSELTDGKYGNISLTEDLRIGLHAESYYVPLEKTSRGTMEQVYFALRMAAMDILCGDEEMPVLLDETFAMYDEKRLEHTLLWLEKSRKQVVIFTCQKREEEALRRLGIPFHKVDLSEL